MQQSTHLGNNPITKLREHSKTAIWDQIQIRVWWLLYQKNKL
jgi:hypothetical protein